MIDAFDYQEPLCPLSGGKAFYYPDADTPQGRIPVDRVIARVDELFGKNDAMAAGKLLTYWRDEAVGLRDRRGELAMTSELVGYYRKQNDRARGLEAVARALVLTDALGQGDMASGATIFINCATAYKAFNMPAEAISLYRRAEEIYRRVLPADDARFGALYNNMALALVDMGDVEGAENAYRRALAVMEQVPGGDAECAITYINLAHMYEVGNPAGVSDCMQRAYALLKSEHLVHDGYYAFVLEKCAPSFAYFGNFDASEEFEKESREIYARA